MLPCGAPRFLRSLQSIGPTKGARMFKPRRITVLLAVFAGSLALTASASAAQRVASGTGSGTACTAAAPCQLRTAVESAAAGDEVIVNSGRYSLSAPLDLPPAATGLVRPRRRRPGAAADLLERRRRARGARGRSGSRTSRSSTPGPGAGSTCPPAPPSASTCTAPATAPARHTARPPMAVRSSATASAGTPGPARAAGPSRVSAGSTAPDIDLAAAAQRDRGHHLCERAGGAGHRPATTCRSRSTPAT